MLWSDNVELAMNHDLMNGSDQWGRTPTPASLLVARAASATSPNDPLPTFEPGSFHRKVHDYGRYTCMDKVLTNPAYRLS